MTTGEPEASSYDAIVIGSGQGGKPLSRSLAAAGWKVALIERAYVGGTCVNVGCTPTKTMVASGRVAALARRAAEYGVATGPVRVDMKEVRRRKQGVVERFRNDGQRGLERTQGLDLVFGTARFEGPRSVSVALNPASNPSSPGGGTRKLTAPHIVINTGCRPSPAGVEGFESVPTLDSTSIMELDEVPEHLLVLGGGYIGVEFGQMFRRFGSRVTLLQRGKQLLAQEDPDVAEEVVSILREDGVEVLLETRAVRVAKGVDGRIRLAAKGPGEERTIEGTHLLAASGRAPNTDDLGLEAAGVKTDPRGFIEVDASLRTSAPGIYAIGDVKGGPAFTHISYDDFRILKTNLLEKGKTTTLGRLVPYTVFTDPQLGRVGLTETQAREQGRKIRVARLPMTSVARAIEMGETRGFLKAVVEEDSGQILGCAVLGVEGGELMAVLEVAMMGRLPCTALRDGIFAHPTLAESLNNLFATIA